MSQRVTVHECFYLHVNCPDCKPTASFLCPSVTPMPPSKRTSLNPVIWRMNTGKYFVGQLLNHNLPFLQNDTTWLVVPRECLTPKAFITLRGTWKIKWIVPLLNRNLVTSTQSPIRSASNLSVLLFSPREKAAPRASKNWIPWSLLFCITAFNGIRGPLSIFCICAPPSTTSYWKPHLGASAQLTIVHGYLQRRWQVRRISLFTATNSLKHHFSAIVIELCLQCRLDTFQTSCTNKSISSHHHQLNRVFQTHTSIAVALSKHWLIFHAVIHEHGPIET